MNEYQIIWLNGNDTYVGAERVDFLTSGAVWFYKEYGDQEPTFILGPGSYRWVTKL
jgi:hypothetical protein